MASYHVTTGKSRTICEALKRAGMQATYHDALAGTHVDADAPGALDVIRRIDPSAQLCPTMNKPH
jgi:hypothetical protein